MTTPPSSSHRQILSIFPFALASLLLIGVTRLVLENSKQRRSLLLFPPEILSFESGEQISWAANFSGNGSVVLDKCNVFDGKWMYDSASYPLYTDESCPYLSPQVTCQKNGRPDSLYQNWIWKPSECELPRFDALKLLEILRNKRLMFVGDSIQRSQHQSMVCLVQSVIPDDGKKAVYRKPSMKIFRAERVTLERAGYLEWSVAIRKGLPAARKKPWSRMESLEKGYLPPKVRAVEMSTVESFQEFNASIEFYWAPFLVESISDHATKHTVQERLVKLDSIAKHSKHWEGADVLVFESYVWWMYKPIINATNGSHSDIKEYNVTAAYRLALRTWVNWLESSIDSRKQKVFFMSSSPTHLWNWEWKAGGLGNCFNESYPIQGPYWGTGSSVEIMGILHDVLQELKVEVTFLNITQLSEFRKDGHTSVYTERRGKLLTSEERADPNTYADCIHWCLPGVPDTWNHILYAHLLADYGFLQMSI